MKNKRHLMIVITIGLLLALTLSFSVWALHSNLTLGKNKMPVSILLCGTDESGANTDVMFIACAEPNASKFSILQIPRDTLVKEEDRKTVKLNSLFASFLADGMSRKQAAVALKNKVSSLLGMKIDHVVIPTLDAVSALVDDLGGLRVSIPKAISYTDPTEGISMTLEAGEQTLNGRDAVAFLRYRSGYTRGDLGRMDAQKIFLAAVFSRFREGVGISFVSRAGKTLSKGGIYTDMSVTNALTTGHRLLSGCKGELLLATLPGEAMYTEGTWYYIPHRAAADKLLADNFSAFYQGSGSFDAARNFSDPDNADVMNAYETSDLYYRIYREKELQNLSL